MLIEKAKQGYEIVVASLYLPSAKSNEDGLITGFRNWLFTRTVNLLHGGAFRDAMTIFWIYSTSSFEEHGKTTECPNLITGKFGCQDF